MGRRGVSRVVVGWLALSLLVGAGVVLAGVSRPAARGPRRPSSLGTGGPALVAGGPGEQHSPVVAAGAAGFLAAWEICEDCETVGADLAVRPLGNNGEPSGPIVALAVTAADERAPSLAYNPDTDEFLAVWGLRYPGVAQRYSVRARRLAPDGTPLGDEVAVAEVDGVWPAAVVSSRGAWHGYDVAWAQPGPRQDVTATIVAARHLDTTAVPAPELWQLSGAEFEALRPLASRASRAAGTLVAWFAYRPGHAADMPGLRGVRLGASGRPTGAARGLSAGTACAAALADHDARADLLLATVGCDDPSAPVPGGQLTVIRLNRSGDSLGEATTLETAVSATWLALAAVPPDMYLVVFPASEGNGAGALAARWLDSGGGTLGAAIPLGQGQAPVAAGGSDGGVVVLAAVKGVGEEGRDVVAFSVVPATPTPMPTSTPARLTPTATSVEPRVRLFVPWSSGGG